MTTDLTRMTAGQTAAAIAAGEVSAVEVAQASLDRIGLVDDALNAFLHVDAEGALAAAAMVDRRRAAGEPLTPLAGVPLALKDLVVTEGIPTTAGSRILEGWRPPYDATITRRIRAAGIVILGKSNLDEFAMGSSGENSAYGPTRNPWDLDRVPGGTSSGSAAAVAAYQAALGIGTDTGGSIRQPAAFCGLVGHRPSYGGVSRYGLVAFASSFDQAGPLARTVRDAALLHTVVGGHDPADATSIDAPVPPVVAAAEAGSRGDLRGVRVGVVRELSGEGYQPKLMATFDRTVALLETMGAQVTTVSCPHFDYSLAAYYLIAPSECSSNLARFDGVRYGIRAADPTQEPDSTETMMSRTRGVGFGEEVKRRIILGTYALSAGYYDEYYAAAQRVRTLIIRDFAAAFARCDVLVSPTAPFVPFRLGERISDPLAMYLSDLCTLPSALAGTPAISVPCGLADGLPVGLQIMAPSMADDRCYRVAAAVEAAQPHPLLAQAPELLAGA